MSLITIWHNPKCSKSRAALEIIEENGCEINIIKYLEQTPNKKELLDTLAMLNLTPRELMRTKEEIYQELNLHSEQDNDKLIDAMIKNPILIERPVIFKNNKAIIGRTTSIIAAFLKS